MTTDTSVAATSEAAILGRLIRPDNGDLRAEAAEALLAIRFDSHELDRMHALAVKKQEDRLSPKEKAEMENYRRVSFLLDLMHSKARRTLKAHQSMSKENARVSYSQNPGRTRSSVTSRTYATSTAKARCPISAGPFPSPKGHWLFSPLGTGSPHGGQGRWQSCGALRGCDRCNQRPPGD
jgi:uncharacterized protein YnzC (UPF0291/DUF896 family)